MNKRKKVHTELLQKVSKKISHISTEGKLLGKNKAEENEN